MEIQIAKICIPSKEGSIEISGSESFVSKQLNKSDKMLDIYRKLVLQAMTEKLFDEISGRVDEMPAYEISENRIQPGRDTIRVTGPFWSEER